jgi:transcriptional regulator with XRE-family HTH domain
MNDISHPMLIALATACRGHRRKHEVTQAAVAERAGISRQAIVEFESARAWPRNPDRIVGAYSDAPFELWREAIKLGEAETT